MSTISSFIASMARMPSARRFAAALLAGTVTLVGCHNTPVDTSDYAQGPAPLRERSPADACCDSYEDCLTGGHIFEMYCAGCHNARMLAERPFANYKAIAAHMRSRANLTGKEYAKLLAWMRRWYDVPPPHPPVEPSPKRFIYSQPISELEPKAPTTGSNRPEDVPPPPGTPSKKPDAAGEKQP
jgi:hypothetical protein